MDAQHHELPASSQLSSVLSDPPPSDNEELGEITVDLNSTTISPLPRPCTISTNMAPSKNTTPKAETPLKRQPRRQTRKPVYKQSESSGDELANEVQVSPLASKAEVSARRSRPNSTTSTKSAMPKTCSRPAATRTKAAPVRGSKRWEPEFVTQNTKSPLVTGHVDLRVRGLVVHHLQCRTVR